jgi:lipoprotein NlpD
MRANGVESMATSKGDEIGTYRLTARATSFRPFQRSVLRLFGMILLASCASHPPAPIEQLAVGQSSTSSTSKPFARAAPVAGLNGDTYRVAPGDTLYSIAWRLDLDPDALVRWNDIANPNRIFVGQALRVKPPAVSLAGSPRTSGAVPPATAKPPTTTTPIVQPVIAEAKPNKPITRTTTDAGWRWPAEGKTTRAVSASGSIGLEIKGPRGQPIKAAKAGEVVYGGSGLRGYGQLLIIKHDELFLSAYAHNDKLLVSEGQRVESGQPIALMGDSEASEVMLHFEIRKGGKAVEPLQYLPQR